MSVFLIFSKCILQIFYRNYTFVCFLMKRNFCILHTVSRTNGIIFYKTMEEKNYEKE